MRRTPANLPEIQDKRAAVIRLRAEGRTWQQVADLAGYSTASGALKAWRKAIQQKPDLAVTEIRAAERERLEQMDATLADIIANPPVQHSAIGKVVIDPRTGEPALNPVPVIAALRERRQVGESYRRLVGADAPAPPMVAVVDNSTRILAEVHQWHADHPGYRRTPGSVIPPGIEVEGPAAIAAWTADQQYRAKREETP